MPTFRITQRRDAYQLYHTTVVAPDAVSAEHMAANDQCVWHEGEVVEFDDRCFDIEPEEVPDGDFQD